MVEGMAIFKYLVRTLDQMDDDWPGVTAEYHARKVGLGETGYTDPT